jgi:hypothetical protein
MAAEHAAPEPRVTLLSPLGSRTFGSRWSADSSR